MGFPCGARVDAAAMRHVVICHVADWAYIWLVFLNLDSDPWLLRFDSDGALLFLQSGPTRNLFF